MKKIEDLYVPKRDTSIVWYLLRVLIPKIQEIINKINTLIKEIK